MRVLNALILVQLACLSSGMDQLHVTFEWKVLDYDFPSEEARQQALGNGSFVPDNNVPVGLDTHGDRLFLTVPRLKPGVLATLNYVSLNDDSKSPLLKPYPSWEAHATNGQFAPEIVSAHRIRIDRCSRLWVMDSGIFTHANNSEERLPAKFMIYDLSSDQLLRSYEIPKEQVKLESNFINIAVEVIDCNNTFAYGVDSLGALVVYSWANNTSWRSTHHFFQLDPLAGQFNIRGHNYTEEKHLYGVALSAPKGNYSTMYFHPLASYNEFVVSTECLRNGQENFENFTRLGTRGSNAQSSVSFLDQKTGVLFYSLVNLNAVACWKTSNKAYDMKNQGRIFMSNETMINPSDIKVDYNDTLWILSNKLPLYEFEILNTTEVNFRVFSAPVIDAINHTACDITPRSNILENIAKSKNASDANGSLQEGVDMSKDVKKLPVDNKPSSADVVRSASYILVFVSFVSLLNRSIL